MLKLVSDIINKSDIQALSEWLLTNPKLTQGELVKEFEEKFAKWQGREYAVFVNSGSSANLLMVSVLKELKYDEITIPALCWSTSIAPFIQLGFKINIKDINEEFKCDSNLTVHPLGFISNNNASLCEDCCESLGSQYGKIKIGNLGLMSSFSFYYGHHISTIEGGMVCTDSKKIYNLLLMMRSHGWDRDLERDEKWLLRGINNIDDFQALYTFYYTGYNLRNTEIGAFLGLKQLEKLDGIIEKRFNNLKLYDKYLKNDYWKIKWNENDVISNFAYPCIHKKRKEIVKELMNNNIECRPLIAGNILNHPFMKKYDKPNDMFADIIHAFGFYIPNHPDLKEDDIKKVCGIINESIK